MAVPNADSAVMKNQVSPPDFVTDCAVPLASATLSKVHWVPNGEQALPVRSELPAAENITIRLRCRATSCTASATEETGTATIASTFSASYQREATPAPTSGLCWC